MHTLSAATRFPFMRKQTPYSMKGVRLLELDNHWSTMETIAYNDAVSTFDRCREFGLLTQVVSGCGSEEAKALVYQEWTLYEKYI